MDPSRSVQVRPEPPLSAPYGAGGGGFSPSVQIRWRVVAIFFAHHIKKRPYLNMMRVTVIDKHSSEERVMVTHEGKEACCYVQGSAWDSPS